MLTYRSVWWLQSCICISTNVTRPVSLFRMTGGRLLTSRLCFISWRFCFICVCVRLISFVYVIVHCPRIQVPRCFELRYFSIFVVGDSGFKRTSSLSRRSHRQLCFKSFVSLVSVFGLSLRDFAPSHISLSACCFRIIFPILQILSDVPRMYSVTVVHSVVSWFLGFCFWLCLRNSFINFCEYTFPANVTLKVTYTFSWWIVHGSSSTFSCPDSGLWGFFLFFHADT